MAADRKARALEPLGEACKRTGWKIHARLGMGHYNRGPQAVRQMWVAQKRRLRQIRRQREHLAKDDK